MAGVDIVCGAPVSFALAPDPKDPTGSVAVQVAADAPPPGMRRGTVLWWAQASFYGSGTASLTPLGGGGGGGGHRLI